MNQRVMNIHLCVYKSATKKNTPYTAISIYIQTFNQFKEPKKSEKSKKKKRIIFVNFSYKKY